MGAEEDKETLRAFIRELDTLLEKYPVSISFGCGCCGSGIGCGDAEYEQGKIYWTDPKTGKKRIEKVEYI
jgi:hypothetical protein